MRFLLLLLLLAALAGGASAQSLRFYGHGGSPGEGFVFPDRVKIDRRPPSNANVGAGDFTVEFFLRATAAENPNGGFSCGSGIDWVNSNILIDADRYNQPRAWGIGLLDGAIAFGITDDTTAFTLCGDVDVLDDQWHHVAVDRAGGSGHMRIWVDGVLDAEGPAGGGGPGGSLLYEADFVPGDFCSEGGGAGSESCANSDPFLVFGAEKHGFKGINFSGFLEEVRLSRSLRYAAPFAPPTRPLALLPDTAALYRFDEPAGSLVVDATGQGADGTLFVGGTPPAGPLRVSETPFASALPSLGPAAAALLLGVLGLVGVGGARLRHTGRAPATQEGGTRAARSSPCRSHRSLDSRSPPASSRRRASRSRARPPA